MSLEIEYKPFNKLVKKIIDNRGKTCPVVRSGFPLIATNCILNRNLYPIFENIRFVSQETYETWFRGHPEPGDMIFVLKGTPGRVNWVPDPVNFCIAQDMVAIRANEQEVYPKYLFAALRSSIIQQEIENLHVGTLIPHFKKSDFDKLFIPCPSYKMQTYIGDTYFYFSQKIDLLQRQNATLEAMAETLFRQWFIEEAQEDWEEKTLEELFDISIGRTPPRKEQWHFLKSNGNIWISIKDMGGEGAYISDSSEYLTAESIYKYRIPLIKKNSVLLSFKMTVGRVKISTQDMYSNEVIACFYPKKGANIFVEWLYIYLKTFKFDSLGTTSSIVTSINMKIIRDIRVRIPERVILSKFDIISRKIFKKIYANQQQIRTLEKLRDTLLPKLMSGEVRVRVDG